MIAAASPIEQPCPPAAQDQQVEADGAHQRQVDLAERVGLPDRVEGRGQQDQSAELHGRDRDRPLPEEDHQHDGERDDAGPDPHGGREGTGQQGDRHEEQRGHRRVGERVAGRRVVAGVQRGPSRTLRPPNR